MTDLVERLRIRQPLLGTLCDEAADEIKRLRAAYLHMVEWNERLRTELARIRGLPRLAALDDEIERLRTERDEMAHRSDQIPFQLDEIERLRALVKDLADDLEAELNGRYPQNIRDYPSEQRRYERDMTNVYEARRALESKP